MPPCPLRPAVGSLVAFAAACLLSMAAQSATGLEVISGAPQAPWPLVDDDGNPVPASDEATPADPLSQTHHGFYLTAREAYDTKRWLGREILFIDVRDRDIGRAVVAPAGLDLNAPVIRRNGNAAPRIARGFAGTVKQTLHARGLDLDTMVFVIGEDGRDSAVAAELLAQAGMTRVFLVRGGMNGEAMNPRTNAGGWLAAGLPVEPVIAQARREASAR